MTFKIALVLAFLAQLAAATLALRLNFRYRIYSAWFFVSAALCVGAILRLSTLCDTWLNPPTFDEDWVPWASAIVSLVAAILALAGMSFIEPFFREMAKAQDALKSDNKRLETIVNDTEEELRLAQRIQRQLLPSGVPELPHLELYGHSDPAEWTSGDYFDFLQLADGSTAMIVADVSGHGLGPALLMSSTRASFRGLASTTCDVGELLSSGNRAVADAVSSHEFVTAMVVRYDETERTLSYAGAGHVAFLIRADGERVTLDADGPPLGILPELKLSATEERSLAKGDILVVVTDGILETENSENSMFGSSRMLDVVFENRDSSAELIVQSLLSACREFAGDRPQQDDITALIVKFVG